MVLMLIIGFNNNNKIYILMPKIRRKGTLLIMILLSTATIMITITTIITIPEFIIINHQH